VAARCRCGIEDRHQPVLGLDLLLERQPESEFSLLLKIGSEGLPQRCMSIEPAQEPL